MAQKFFHATCRRIIFKRKRRKRKPPFHRGAFEKSKPNPLGLGLAFFKRGANL